MLWQAQIAMRIFFVSIQLVNGPTKTSLSHSKQSNDSETISKFDSTLAKRFHTSITSCAMNCQSY